MKISKNELRKMIFETVLQREKALNEASLRKMRKTIIDAQEEDERQEDGDVTIKDNPDVDKVIKDLEDFKKANKGPFNPKNKPRAQEAEELLRFAKEAKAGKKPAPPANPTTDADQVEQNDASGNEDWKKYENESEWEYKIEGDTSDQIWVTRKANSAGPVYKLNKPKYAVTVNKLDNSEQLPDRTAESIKNDPALKKPAAKTAADKKTDSGTRLTTPSNLDTSNSADNRAGTESPGGVEAVSKEATPALPAIKVSQKEKDLVTLRMAAYEIDFLPQQLKLDYENQRITTALMQHIKRETPNEGQNKSNEDLAKMILLRDTDLGSAQIAAFKNENNYAGILKAMSDLKKGFDLEGQDSKYPKGFKENLLGALARAFSKKPEDFSNIPVNESKVIYGKSHATLLRERYWGRY